MNGIGKIVNHYSFENQLEQAIEEASEFILAAQKYKRFATQKEELNLIEETADLTIMMQQMRLYLGSSAVDYDIDRKLKRQILRIESEQRTED